MSMLSFTDFACIKMSKREGREKERREGEGDWGEENRRPSFVLREK
jgi:hypothetical protein